MLELSFITPTSYARYIYERKSPTTPELFLYHLLKKDKVYRELASFYKGYKILDNSFYEERRFSSGLNTYFRFACEIGANCIVLPDGTTDGFNEALSLSKSVMLVPTTFEQFVEFVELTFKYRKGVVKVGLGGLHAVNMLDLISIQNTESRAKVFHFKNRYLVLKQLESQYKDIYDRFISNQHDVGIATSNLHFLGLGDYPLEEIRLLLSLVKYASLDSSAFVWSYLRNGQPWYKLGEKTKKSKINFRYESRDFDDSVKNYFDRLIKDFSIIRSEEELMRSIEVDDERSNNVFDN